MSPQLATQITVVKAARDQNKPIKVIAREMGLSPARIGQIVSAGGLARKWDRPLEQYATVGKLRSDGFSLGGIARHLGITKNTAAAMVRKAQALGCGAST